MESSKEKGNQSPKQITYQIGWRKGKIEYSPENKRGSARRMPISPGVNHFHLAVAGSPRWIWKELPLLPVRAAVALLWVLPAISFGLVLWLVFMLANY